MSNGYPPFLLNDEQMSNKVGGSAPTSLILNAMTMICNPIVAPFWSILWQFNLDEVSLYPKKQSFCADVLTPRFSHSPNTPIRNPPKPYQPKATTSEWSMNLMIGTFLTAVESWWKFFMKTSSTWICLRWFFTLYHGIHHHHTTLWENMFGTFSKHRRVANPSELSSESRALLVDCFLLGCGDVRIIFKEEIW